MDCPAPLHLTAAAATALPPRLAVAAVVAVEEPALAVPAAISVRVHRMDKLNCQPK
jgi:hypothetical protein